MERKSPEKRSLFKKYILIITYAIVLFLVLYNIGPVWQAVKWALNILSPFFLGIVFAFIVHLPMGFFQYKVLGSWEHGRSRHLKKLWRGVSMLLAYASIFLAITLLIVMILPPIGASIGTLAGNFSNYLMNFQIWSDGFLSSLSINPAISNLLDEVWLKISGMLQQLFKSILNGAFGLTVDITSGFINIVMALMLSIFMLYNKEKLFSQLRRLCNSICGRSVTDRAREVLCLVDTVFGKFIVGKVTDSLITGVLCFIGMTVFGMDYALLISSIVMVTNIIPILGPWIGTIPCALILLVIEPMQAVWFVVFIIILQQLDGNFIYPRVVGNAVGLPAIWVLTSVLVGGGVFGIWGMLLGTPTAAVCYRLIGDWLHKRESLRRG